MNLRISFLTLLLATAAAGADELGRQVLDEINLARTQPQRYAEILASGAGNFRGSEGPRAVEEAIAFLRKARPVPPLAWSPGIGQAALSHTLDVGPRGGHGHNGANGDTPWKRMSRFGKFQGNAGENIDYGHSDPRGIVASLIIDNGVRSRMHRTNLFNRAFRVVGVAVGPHANWGSMCVMDFASKYYEAGDERIAARTGALRSIYSGMSFF